MSTRFSQSNMEMSRLTRDGTAETVSRDQILRRERGQGKFIFPVQLTTCRMGNLTRLIHTLAICVTIHNVGDKTTVILYTTFIAIVVSHIQRIGRQPGKTTLHSGQSRSSWSAEQGNVYSSVYAIIIIIIISAHKSDLSSPWSQTQASLSIPSLHTKNK